MWDVQPEVAVAAGLISPGPVARWASALNRFAIRRAACVIVPTESIARTAVDLGVSTDRVQTIPHWEDLDIVPVRPKGNPFSLEHDLADRFVVMYAGNHGLTQELSRYLELAIRLKDLEDVRFVFVGDGAAKRGLEARVASLGLTTVKFLPYEDRERMADSLASADVFLAPVAAGLTRYMLPSKIFTFLAAGRPFIAALDPSSDLRDLVRRHDCGFVVEPGDIMAVEARIRRLHANREECLAMGRRGRQAAEAIYARPVVTGQFMHLLSRFEAVSIAAVPRVQ